MNAIPFVHFISLAGNPLVYTDYLAVATAAAVYPEAQIIVWVDQKITFSTWGKRIFGLARQVVVPLELSRVSHTLPRLARQSDYLRYDILYRYGGLYLDTDTICVKSIANLPTNGLVIGEETSEGLLNNAVMYAPAAGDPVMRELLNACLVKIADGSYKKSICSLGPYLCNEVLLGKSKGITRLPMRFFSYYPWYQWERWFDNSPIHPDIHVVHWFRSIDGNIADKLLTPQYIRKAHSLIAQCARKGLSQARRINQWPYPL